VELPFGKKYSVEVPKLVFGLNTESFHIDRSFFEAFEFSHIPDGDLTVKAEITRYATHLDAKFFFDGWVSLECDRCMEPYRHGMKFQQRIVYTFDESLEFDTDEVVLIDESVPVIHLAQDFYDFIHLEIPLRKVPSAKVHLCAPEVLELLNLNPDGSEKVEQVLDEEPLDPRWQALKKLKDSQDSEQ
jgi:uncharacterized metal-binding protein YceD (DUF177 family)